MGVSRTPRGKLCLVIPSLSTGGMQRVMSVLASFLCQKEEFEVHLVLYGKVIDNFYYLPDNLIIHKPGVVFNNNLRLVSSLRRLLFLRETVKKIDPVSILSFGEIWNSFVLLALIGYRYPVFVSDRCRPDKTFGFFHENLRRLLYKYASAIIVQTNQAKDIYQVRFRSTQIIVIGNPIRELAEGNDNSRENIILTVGRLIPSKNHAALIETFVKLNNHGWKLVIVGGDAQKMNLMMELRTRISKLCVEDQVILTGTRPDVESFYLGSKIFVLTSDSEGFPNVIGEAMSAGLPVVAFNCIAGPSDLISDGEDGYLVPLHDYGMLGNRLTQLMNDTELRERFGRRARNNVKRYGVEKIGEKYYSLITSGIESTSN
jgi:GalNAc-alpha-(1->4)-GalNAc-alpha-(1->3)-diNAcBac-PP-undecaprenol alpha-1,4-N-acetyl-D-galactosaminyltransferase